jgi:hypothetical protein
MSSRPVMIISTGARCVGIGTLTHLSGGYNEESRNGQPIGRTGLFAQAGPNVMPIPDRRAGPAGLPILLQAESGWKVVLPRTREDHLRQACPAGLGTRVGAVAVTAHRGLGIWRKNDFSTPRLSAKGSQARPAVIGGPPERFAMARLNAGGRRYRTRVEDEDVPTIRPVPAGRLSAPVG